MHSTRKPSSSSRAAHTGFLYNPVVIEMVRYRWCLETTDRVGKRTEKNDRQSRVILAEPHLAQDLRNVFAGGLGDEVGGYTVAIARAGRRVVEVSALTRAQAVILLLFNIPPKIRTNLF